MSDKTGGRTGKKAGKTADGSRDGKAAATPEGERIAKVLARRGVASRRSAETMIAEGRVSVNGTVIDSPALNVTGRDRILVDGNPLQEAEPSRLWLYHKPQGLVTTEKDEKGRPTVFAALPPELGRVVSVGRLDLNSEGLLLLTNDGALKRRLELPSTGWLRRYRVRVHGAPSEAMLEPLRHGVTVEGERFLPMEVALDRQQGANAWLTVGLREGRNREVRRAMEAVGLTVNRLIRISYGPFQLGDLKPGAVEEIRRKVLRDQLGLPAAPDAGQTGGAGKTTVTRRARPAPGPLRASRGGPPPAGSEDSGSEKTGGRPGPRAARRSSSEAAKDGPRGRASESGRNAAAEGGRGPKAGWAKAGVPKAGGPKAAGPKADGPGRPTGGKPGERSGERSGGSSGSGTRNGPRGGPRGRPRTGGTGRKG